jgi:hypothetical protein
MELGSFTEKQVKTIFSNESWSFLRLEFPMAPAPISLSQDGTQQMGKLPHLGRSVLGHFS